MDEIQESVRERIKLITSKLGLNPNQLAKLYSVNQKTLNNQINGQTEISVSTILLIIKAIPNLSTEWLFKGIGEPELTNSADSGNQYYEICKMLLENRNKDTELYRKLADIMSKEQ